MKGIKKAGSGSGGSIHIIINENKNLQMDKNSYIEAIGGIGQPNPNNNKYWKCQDGIDHASEGGIGRIRIQLLSNDYNDFNCNNIIPRPYLG